MLKDGLGAQSWPAHSELCCWQGRQDAASRAFIGLLVHSAADGFAVGASSMSDSASLSFLVAVAMVLHKVLCNTRFASRAHTS